jgi:hypothetical protein
MMLCFILLHFPFKYGHAIIFKKVQMNVTKKCSMMFKRSVIYKHMAFCHILLHFPFKHGHTIMFKKVQMAVTKKYSMISRILVITVHCNSRAHFHGQLNHLMRAEIIQNPNTSPIHQLPTSITTCNTFGILSLNE